MRIFVIGGAVGARVDCTFDVFVDHGGDYLPFDLLGDIRRDFHVVVNQFEISRQRGFEVVYLQLKKESGKGEAITCYIKACYRCWL